MPLPLPRRMVSGRHADRFSGGVGLRHDYHVGLALDQGFQTEAHNLVVID